MLLLKLKELESERTNRYYLYDRKISDIYVDSGIERIFTDDTDFFNSARLRNHKKRYIDLILSLNGTEYPISTMIENVTERAYTIGLDSDVHGKEFYEQASLSFMGLRLTRSNVEAEDDWEAPDFSIAIVTKKGELLPLDFDSRGMLFHEEFTASLSEGSNSQSGESYSHIDFDFDRSELDLADIDALIINGVTYQLND